MPDELFVYGTLHPDRAPLGIATAVRSLTFVAQGTILGRLYDLGEYTGVVLTKVADQCVPGFVYALPQDTTVLAELDRYEEFEPDNVQESLFVRTKTMATFADGQERQCWVYVYNKPLPIQ